MTQICTECANARQKFQESCFCVKYGIIIGYSKTNCPGFDPEESEEEHEHSYNHRESD